MSSELNSRVIKTIVGRHPNIRSMVRNHPYGKIVGVAVVKCLEDRLGLENEHISDEMLEEMIDKGIRLYDEKREKFDEAPVLEQKRKLLCDHLYEVAQEHLSPAES